MEINDIHDPFSGFDFEMAEKEMTALESYLWHNGSINVEFSDNTVVHVSHGSVLISKDGKEICRIYSYGKEGMLSPVNGKIPSHVFKWLQRIEDSIKIHEKLEKELTAKIEQLENKIATLHVNEHAMLEVPIEDYVKENAEKIEKTRAEMQNVDIDTLTREFMAALFHEFAETQFLQREKKHMKWKESFLAKEVATGPVEYEENEETMVNWERKGKEEKILFTFRYNDSEIEVREQESYIEFYNQGELLYFTSKEDMHRGGYDAGRYELKKHIPKNMLDVLRDIEEARAAWRCEWFKYHDEDSAPIDIYKILREVYLENGHTGKLVSGEHYQIVKDYGEHIQKLDDFKNEIESKFQELDSILESLSS